MQRLLAVGAVLEAMTGIGLTVSPSIVARLLLGEDVAGAGTVVGRVCGFALLALALACWPSCNTIGELAHRRRALLTYNLLITCYLILLGFGGQFSGVLLWPAAALHFVMTLLLIRQGAGKSRI